MAGESYAIPPKDHAVEGILWYIQHHQLAGGDRLHDKGLGWFNTTDQLDDDIDLRVVDQDRKSVV